MEDHHYDFALWDLTRLVIWFYKLSVNSLHIPIPQMREIVRQKKVLGIFGHFFYILFNTGVPRAIKFGAREE
jgi:hypothetical protein